ncbi:hypothetical protein J7T55_006469 [Diaporthe amygdali]|uniref:uncharacterized protein n=1 Tax=Phomopsis amygdali TaxID=1214568 RepID=UPI0022FDD9D8|nr:uncharacterized protein J7T55_006469 [Diaporthe amygdali]KAJ0125125.1 hypothetical protein J7T55_006469 [Diaporthe amygdali]
MQFLAIVSLALAGLASAATVPEVNKRASTPPGCANAYYNDGSDGSTGGWGCAGSTTWGDCTSYYWKESPPFWSEWTSGLRRDVSFFPILQQYHHSQSGSEPF